MFTGATPRTEFRELDGVQAVNPIGAAVSPLSDALESIFLSRRSGRVLYETLLEGVEAAGVGEERVEICEARQRDAEAALRRLECIGNATGKESKAIIEEESEPARGGPSPRKRSQAPEVTLAWVVGSVDMLQKAMATLEANELLSMRACRQYNVHHAARLAAYESGTAQPSAPRRPSSKPSGVPQNELQPPASFIQMHMEAAALKSRVKQHLQDFGGPRKELDIWSWLFSSILEACTNREDEADHSASVTDIVKSMYLRTLQAEKGDMLCCTPIHVDLQGVRYRTVPEEDGRVMKASVARGDKVKVKGRKGDWVWNSNGYLPLRHPVDGSLLFLFDHKWWQEGDDEDSSGNESSLFAKFSTARSPRTPIRQVETKQVRMSPQVDAG